MTNTYGPSYGQESVPAWKDEWPAGHETARHALDLNDLVEAALQRLQKPEVSQAFIRCDELPLVKGSAEKLSTTVYLLLSYIMDAPPPGSDLFLYIKCDTDGSAAIDPGIRKSECGYRISFQTNSLAEAASFPEEQRKYCSDCLQEMNGELILNTQPGTGWLFILEVKGKIEISNGTG